MNTCIASELDHFPRILPARARYKFEVNFKKLQLQNQILNAKYNFQNILNRGAMKTLLAFFYPQALYLL
jgi:hypothetical protein